MSRSPILYSFLFLACLILTVPAHAELPEDNNAGWEGLYTKYDDQKAAQEEVTAKLAKESEANNQEEYRAMQLLDGWAALGVAVGEPLYFRPAIWVKRCIEGQSFRTAVALSPACASVGVIEGVFFSLFDLSTGIADILTGGYFRMSKKAGVFEYFE